MNMIRKSNKPMLKRAGIETARENNKVRIPFALFTNLNTRPTLKTLMTLIKVGDTKCLRTKFIRAKPVAKYCES